MAHQTSGLVDNLSCCMSDVLGALCPYMMPEDRTECLRYLALYQEEAARKKLIAANKQAEVEAKEAKERSLQLTDEEVTSLKQLFHFFDADNSGYVDQAEVMRVLRVSDETERYERNLRQMKGEVMVEGKDMDEEQVQDILAFGDMDNDYQLDFMEFAILFRDSIGLNE